MGQPARLASINFYNTPTHSGYYSIPLPTVQSIANQFPQIPVLPSVDEIGHRSLQRSALASLQNLPILEPYPLAASPHIHQDLEKILVAKVAEHRRLASMKNNNVSAATLVQAMGPTSTSTLFYRPLPASHAPSAMLRSNLPPIQPQPQQGPIPAAAVQILPQQEKGAQPPASEKSASLKRQAPIEPAGQPLGFIETTPESFHKAQEARAEKRARAQQGLPEPEPVVPKKSASRKRATHPKEKPAAAGLDFKNPLTPETYLAESAKTTRKRFIEPYYATSEDALAASHWISEAAKYLDAQEYTEAITAIHLAYEKLPEEGFIYKLFVELDREIYINSDLRICTSDPEEDLDVLVLRGIRKIKHGNYEEAKTDLQKVLTRHPNDQFARLIFDHACLLSNGTLQDVLSSESAEATNYDSVK